MAKPGDSLDRKVGDGLPPLGPPLSRGEAPRAIVLDLDDTLYPERAYVFSGFDAVSRAFQGDLGDPSASAADMRRLFDSPHRARVFDVLLEERKRGVDRSLVQRMVSTYRGHSPGIWLHADAERALSRWRGRFRLGLITDGRSADQWAKIDALGLRSRLDPIIMTEEMGEGNAKPHLAPFEEMARRLGVDPRRCSYVADNPMKDFLAPNQLGWMTIRVWRADGIYRDASAPSGGEARFEVATLDEVDALLG